MPFHHQFILDRQYYTEVYEQTAQKPQGWPAYRKAIILLILGLVASSFATTAKFIHLSYFVIGLAVVEALAVRFAKTWWLWRQLISKAANNPVDLTLDEQGINITSAYLNQQLNWQNITNVVENEYGFILEQTGNRHYLSKKGLAQEAIAYVAEKCHAISNNN
ncbi:YcxB family protein [Thalassotalea eurytherma]|uniref:YcxB-like C-terminal domain-containing protein n=1 Tax=Thalassotalea eurytherma TaxID=1144278 RepID=A0ABQ6H237_9GAMM|nr:YcxB family protein [Thalassotalea eurytherma]GLX81589.1 hypothetical protein theurythT_10410 [Thalassotalea eurytherma]